jgi:Uma2 family endonuclease
MSAVLDPVAPATSPPVTGHLVMRGTWATYQKVLALRGEDYPSMRITYDRGRLEVMTISSPHERLKYYLGRIIDALSEELGIEVVGQGHATVSRQDLDRGFEPDMWYYVQHAAAMRPRRVLDFGRDPPPDLAVEIEISRSVIDRLGLYAAMGVPEIWRHDGTNLTVLHLQPDRTYAERPASLAFPGFPLAQIGVVIAEAEAAGSVQAFRNLRQWIRNTLVPPANP